MIVTGRRMRRLITQALCAAVLGCGGATPTPPGVASRADAILTASARALERLHSYHAVGMVSPGYGVDLDLVHARGLQGALTYKGLRWETTVVGSQVYFRGAALWRATQPPATAAALADQWVLMQGATGYYGWLELLPRLDVAIANEIFAKHHPIDRISTGSVGGRRATHLSGPGDTYDVSDDGGPSLPLRWTDLREPPVDGELCGLTLDRFNTTAAIMAPPSVPYSGVPQVVGTTPPAMG
ncbi:MAG: hypothetical protein NVSMB29_07870 [Candidatus Dormibacteria bacterium]